MGVAKTLLFLSSGAGDQSWGRMCTGQMHSTVEMAVPARSLVLKHPKKPTWLRELNKELLLSFPPLLTAVLLLK